MEQFENITIRHANMEDFDNVKLYLKKYWDYGEHIFIRNVEYFKYFQVNKNRFNMYIGEGELSKDIYGICGYILCNGLENPDVQLNLLHVKENKNKFNSLQLVESVKSDLKSKVFSSCGIRPKTKIIYDFLGYHTGTLKHYYRLADKKRYNVAVVNNKKINSISKGEYILKLIPTIDDLKEKFKVERYKYLRPYKDENYIYHRYYDNMAYKYNVYGIDKGKEQYDSIIMLREIRCNDSKICKIVDFIGLDEDLSQIGEELQRLIDENSYEYIDFYCYGIDEFILDKAGFTLRDKEDNNIIPQLFEPFVQKNKEIYFFTNTLKDFHAYRGDSDQDRANIL